MWKTAGLAVLAAAAAGCGSKEQAAPKPEPAERPLDAAAARRWERVKPSPVSPVCQAARGSYGALATCVEVELPALATAAGKVYRVHDAADPTKQRLYALVAPSGEVTLDSGDRLLDAITAQLDLAATPAETLAHLYATLDIDSAVVRCLPGDAPLPAGKVYREHPCAPPAIGDDGGKKVLTVIVETFPDPGMLNRDDHMVWFHRVELRDHELSSLGGEGLIEADRAAPRPASLPPLPEMTAPPAWVAEPVEAAAELSEALCAEARAKVSGLEGQRCEAYGYPSLELPTGTLYYLANDAGQRHLLALKKPDGTIVAGDRNVTAAEHHPLIPIIKSYDPAVVPAAKFLAASLLLAGEPARILCLPGSGDAIPDHECVPPTASKQGEELVVEAILEELPLRDGNGMVSDPAIRSFTYRFGPGGGFTGDGFRLVDLRPE